MNRTIGPLAERRFKTCHRAADKEDTDTAGSLLAAVSTVTHEFVLASIAGTHCVVKTWMLLSAIGLMTGLSEVGTDTPHILRTPG